MVIIVDGKVGNPGDRRNESYRDQVNKNKRSSGGSSGSRSRSETPVLVNILTGEVLNPVPASYSQTSSQLPPSYSSVFQPVGTSANQGQPGSESRYVTVQSPLSRGRGSNGRSSSNIDDNSRNGILGSAAGSGSDQVSRDNSRTREEPKSYTPVQGSGVERRNRFVDNVLFPVYTTARELVVRPVSATEKTRQQLKSIRSQNPTNPVVSGVLYLEEGALRFPSSARNSADFVGNALNPRFEENSVILFGAGAYKITKQSIKEGNLLEGVADKAIRQPFLADPSGFVTDQIVGTVVISKSFEGVGRGVKDLYVEIGSSKVDPSRIFSTQVLSGETNLPLSRGTDYALKRFNTLVGGDEVLTVSTASPTKISGKEVGFGRKGGLTTPIEDAGVYVTPGGEASPYFLRLSKEQTGGYSFNPFNSFENGLPTITEFEVKSVELQPRNIVNTPGFSASRDFLESQAFTGKAFITKRSEIGQGSVKARSFTAREAFEAPFNLGVQRNGASLSTSKILRGDILREAGTSELEAVIPPKATFKYLTKGVIGKAKGFNEYTVFEGRNVVVRRARLLSEEAEYTKDLVGYKTSRTPRSVAELSSQRASLSRELYSSKTSLAPYFSLSSVSRSRSGSRSSGSSVSRASYPSYSYSSIPESSLTGARVSEGSSRVSPRSSGPSSISRSLSSYTSGASRGSSGSSGSSKGSSSYSSIVNSKERIYQRSNPDLLYKRKPALKKLFPKRDYSYQRSITANFFGIKNNARKTKVFTGLETRG